MKKILLSILTLTTLGASAQLPPNPFAVYEFTSGSSANTAPTTATDLTGSFTATNDRFSTISNAADITGLLVGTNLGSTNLLNTTLSFWMKNSTITANQRILQMYGTGGNGYRIDMDGGTIIILGKATNNISFSEVGMTASVDIDDNSWHHIAVKTTGISSNQAVHFELFIDGVAIVLSSNVVNPPGSDVVHTFLENASFRIDPLTGVYTGDIDDIYLYKSTLLDDQITNLFNYTPAPLPTKFYVDIDATGNNDGSTWTDAFTNLEDALNNAHQNMEVWVAEGTYIHNNQARNSVFAWTSDSVKVYGGFEGNETLLTERDWRANKTIMSGDKGTIGDITDNSYTVFTGPTGSIINVLNYGLLDGFIIQDGYANSSGGHAFGAAGSGFLMTEYIRKMKLVNCEISNNSAKYSAILAYSTQINQDLIIESCIIKNNTGRVGVAMIAETYGSFDLSVTIDNCLFSNNESKDMGALGDGLGAVIYLQATLAYMTININNTTFANNPNNGTHTANMESTIVCYSPNGGTGKTLRVDNCIFWGNTNDAYSIRTNPNGGDDFNSVEVNNTLSEFSVYPTGSNLSNNLSVDPLFTNAATNDFTLQSTSPAIDAGAASNLVLTTLDLAGNPRVSNSIVDMGCYEFTPSGAGINEATNGLGLTTYPNPTTGNVTFKSTDISSASMSSIEIYNLTGQKVAEFTNTNTINISNLSNGMYTAKITSDQQVGIVKLIKE